jgi:hypothetical protein
MTTGASNAWRVSSGSLSLFINKTYNHKNTIKKKNKNTRHNYFYTNLVGSVNIAARQMKQRIAVHKLNAGIVLRTLQNLAPLALRWLSTKHHHNILRTHTSVNQHISRHALQLVFVVCKPDDE